MGRKEGPRNLYLQLKAPAALKQPTSTRASVYWGKGGLKEKGGLGGGGKVGRRSGEG